MPERTREPYWLNRLVLDAIHDEQIREHGGLAGRDENSIESALARPCNKWANGVRDLASLAAAYAFALVTGHPYVDGNKRVGFLAAVTFLGMNDVEFEATDVEILNEIMALAAGRIREDRLANWIRTHSQ